ncbi:hypothetical protein, partial [uncultured Paraglaciecola sp.]|uniref:hypothetical protein n=1 Tax=uncultured Paraglaciecola sp. TaxID=1765024 RepID=UPI0025FB89C8
MTNQYPPHSTLLLKYSLMGLPLMFILGCGGSDSSNSSQSSPVNVVIVEEAPTLRVEAYPATDQSQFLPRPSLGCDLAETNSDSVFNDVSQNAGLCYDTTISSLDGTTARVSGGIAVS